MYSRGTPFESESQGTRYLEVFVWTYRQMLRYYFYWATTASFQIPSYSQSIMQINTVQHCKINAKVKLSCIQQLQNISSLAAGISLNARDYVSCHIKQMAKLQFCMYQTLHFWISRTSQYSEPNNSRHPPTTCSAGVYKFLWWHIFASPQYGTCFISPFWHLEI